MCDWTKEGAKDNDKRDGTREEMGRKKGGVNISCYFQWEELDNDGPKVKKGSCYIISLPSV